MDFLLNILPIATPAMNQKAQGNYCSFKENNSMDQHQDNEHIIILPNV